jgi:hypothetical protein
MPVPPPGTGAQHAVARAAVQLLVPEGEMPPLWLGAALDNIVGAVALFWRERQAAPRATELARVLARLRDNIDTLEQLCGTSRTLEAVVLRNLFPDPAPGVMATGMAAQMSRGGQGDALDRFGWPAPKLLVACATIELCRAVGDTPPNPKNKHALAFSGALLWRAREQAGDPAPAMDARASQWTGSLAKARRIYADEGVVNEEQANVLNFAAYQAAVRDRPLFTARRLVDGIIERAQKG